MHRVAAFAFAAPVVRAPSLQRAPTTPLCRARAPRRLLTMSATKGTHKAAMDDVSVTGEFKRKQSVFRSELSDDGSTPFAPEKGRYHLYMSLACPWASRCYTVLSLKGLLESVSVTVVDHFMGEKGWRFVTESTEDPPPMCVPEPLYGFTSIRDVYFKASPDYDARFTVPVLWDKKTETIVSNESSEIIVMLNKFSEELGGSKTPDLYPAAQQAEIAKVAESFYNGFNNGVYRSGFATSQEAYSVAVKDVFKTLQDLEERLSKSRYLCGDELTLADIRLFPTLIRFDPGM